jgi:hypothetical protein
VDGTEGERRISLSEIVQCPEFPGMTAAQQAWIGAQTTGTSDVLTASRPAYPETATKNSPSRALHVQTRQ